MGSISEFTLSPCTVDDVPAMITCYQHAFESNHFSPFIFPQTIDPAKKYQWLFERFTATFSKPGIKNFKMTHIPSGNIAAWIHWGYPHTLTDEQKAEQEKEKKRKEEAKQNGVLDSEWPEGANIELVEAKFGGLETLGRSILGRTIFVYLLSTDPAYQRKGLASTLLKHGLDLADVEGRKAYIEATELGHPVYRKLGFEDVDEVVVDLRKWGGKEPGTSVIMVRDQQPKA